jgi:hypothetical protein
MKSAIDPTWSLPQLVEAAFRDYRGVSRDGAGRRLNMIRTWANVVGRRRALAEWRAFVLRSGGLSGAALRLKIAEDSAKRLARFLGRVSDHRVLLPGEASPSEYLALSGFEALGDGASGEVWKAQDPLGRTVAVKFMHPNTPAADLAFSHAQVLALSGGHPNIVTLHFCHVMSHPARPEQALAIVMEYVPGETLERRLSRPLSVAEAKEIGGSIGSAILHIHERGLVHGDLHVRNVMVTPEGTVKVIDLLNERRLTSFTSGARAFGEHGDTEQLRAILCQLARHSGLAGPILGSIKEALDSASDPTELLVRFAARMEPLDGLNLPMALPSEALLVLADWKEVEAELRSAAARSGITAKPEAPIGVVLRKLGALGRISPTLERRVLVLKESRDLIVFERQLPLVVAPSLLSALRLELANLTLTTG